MSDFKKSLCPVYKASQDLIALAESSVDLPIIRGSVVSSNSFPSPKELFPVLKKDGVLSIDMETSAFYQIAWLFGIPALANRAVSNQLDHNGDDEHIAELDVAGSIRVASDYVLKLVDVLRKGAGTRQNTIDSTRSNACSSV